MSGQVVNVPGPGDSAEVGWVTPGTDIAPVPDSVVARVSALESVTNTHEQRLYFLDGAISEHNSRLVNLEAASGDPDAVQSIVDTAIETHRNDPTPHPVYDTHLPSLKLLFENGLV